MLLGCKRAKLCAEAAQTQAQDRTKQHKIAVQQEPWPAECNEQEMLNLRICQESIAPGSKDTSTCHSFHCWKALADSSTYDEVMLDRRPILVPLVVCLLLELSNDGFLPLSKAIVLPEALVKPHHGDQAKKRVLHRSRFLEGCSEQHTPSQS